MNNLKIGILGCGRVSSHYKGIFLSKKIQNFSIIFCCDLIIDKAKYLAKVLNADYGTSYEKLIKKHKIDLIIILTESGYHFNHARYFLQNNINVLIEKPATFSFKESEKLYRLAVKKKLLCSVGFQNRLNIPIQLLKSTLEKNRLGKIITSSVKLNWCRYQDYYNDKWHGSWELDGGVTNQQAIHHIDAINWLLGPVLRVNSFMTKRLNKLEAEDTMVALLHFKSGNLGTIEATTSARPRDFEGSITILGEKGRIKIGGIALNKIIEWDFIKKQKFDNLVKKKYSLTVPNGYGLGHYELLNNIINKILNKDDVNVINIKSTFETTKIISALYKSDELGKNVRLNSNNILSCRLGKKYVRK